MDDIKGIIRLEKPSNQVVDANGLNDILTEYCWLWRGIGLNLGLRSKVIDNIERDYTEQRRRFEMTLEKWQMQDGGKATWGALELAITNANRADLSYNRLEEVPVEPKQDSNGQQIQFLNDLESDAGNLSAEEALLVEQPSQDSHDQELPVQPVQPEDNDDGPVHTPTEESEPTTLCTSCHPVTHENRVQSEWTDTIRHRITESHANKAPATSTSNNQYQKKKQTEKPPAVATTALVRNNFRHRHNELERCCSFHNNQTNETMIKMTELFVVAIQQQQTQQQRVTIKDEQWKISREECCLAIACCGIVVLFLITYCITLLLLFTVISVLTFR